MTAKREAEQQLENIVSLAQSVIARAKAAQAAIATIGPIDIDAERKDER